MRAEYALDEEIGAHPNYEDHEFMDYYEEDYGDAGETILALVYVTYNSSRDYTGGSFYEVWEYSEGWYNVDPYAAKNMDLRDYDDNYNPTDMELLAEAHTHNQ